MLVVGSLNPHLDLGCGELHVVGTSGNERAATAQDSQAGAVGAPQGRQDRETHTSHRSRGYAAVAQACVVVVGHVGGVCRREHSLVHVLTTHPTEILFAVIFSKYVDEHMHMPV